VSVIGLLAVDAAHQNKELNYYYYHYHHRRRRHHHHRHYRYHTVTMLPSYILQNLHV
jgi:hypothetical protein